MALSSAVSSEQLAVFKRELLELLQANDSSLDLATLQASYCKKFQKNISVKQYGITSIKHIETLFGDLMGVVIDDNRQFLRLLKLPESEMFSSNESVRAVEPRGLSEQDVKRQNLLGEVVRLLQQNPEGVTIGQLTSKYRLMFGKDIRIALKSCGIARTPDALATAFGSLSVHTKEKTTYTDWLQLKQDSVGASEKPSRRYPVGADKQQLDKVFENIQNLIKRKKTGIRLNMVSKKYKKSFNCSLNSYGLNNGGQVAKMFSDEFEVQAIPKTKRKTKIYLKDAERFEDSGSLDDGDDSDDSESSDLMSNSSLPMVVKVDKNAVHQRSLMSSPTPKVNVNAKRDELKKELIGLLQIFPEGIGLHCLHRAYEQRYPRPFTLEGSGVDSVASLNVAFSDVFVVVSQCDELKHKFVRIRQSADVNTVSGLKKGKKSEQIRKKIEELLKPYPAGIAFSTLSHKYSQQYRQSAPKNKVIMETYKNDFVFFSKCNTEGHQFLKLKPNWSLTGTSSKAKAQPNYSAAPSTGPLQAVTARPPLSYFGQNHQYGQVSENVAQVHVNENYSGRPGVLGGYPPPLMASPLLHAPIVEPYELQRNPHKVKVAPQHEYRVVPTSWSGDLHLETERCLPKRPAASLQLEKQQQEANLDANSWPVLGSSDLTVNKARSRVQDALANLYKDNAAVKRKEEHSKQKQPAEKRQKIQPKQQVEQQSVIPKQKEQQQQPVRQLKAAPRQKIAKQQDPNQSREDAAAENIITNLAEANELVTVSRVVELLKQQFQVTNLRGLRVNRETDIPSINQLVRLQAKVNAFIQAFVKVRAICTLYELKECLAMVEAPFDCTDKLDYSSLELGPLVKQRLVWDFFKFPPTKDDSDIPKITTLDILENLRVYLQVNNMWRSKVKLEDFMEYLIKEYNVEGPWDLGVKINSLGLGIAAIKTAQREQKNVMDQARKEIKTRMKDDAEDAMERIRKAVMSPADITGHEFTPGPQLELRHRYVNMSAAEAINSVFTKAIELVEYDRDLHHFCLSLSKVVSKPLSCSLFQLALCTGDLKEPEDLPKGLLDSDSEEEYDDDDDDYDEEDKGPDGDRITSKTQPTEDQVKQELVCYFDRLQHGIPNLKDLARIETKVCQHFGFQNFLTLSRAKKTFLEFLSIDHPGILESIGGTLMGLASGKPSQGSVYRPSRLDLVEFIRQCDPHKESQDTLDCCLRAHYQVGTVEELGHGPVNRLSQPLIKMAATLGRHYQQDSNAVIYETALCAANRRNESKNKEVGLFGSQRVDSALLCLQSAPLLEDLAEWSHWTMVFEPEHGDLKAFLESNLGLTLSPPIKINALEVRPGVLLRLATETSNDLFAAAAKSGDSVNTVGHLVSLVVKDGPRNIPLALLSNHMETALNVMGVASDHKDVVGFILECLEAVPLQIGQAVVRQVFLNPLVNVLGSEVKSRQLILASCKTTRQKSRIQSLGLLLGISQWKDSFLEQRMPRNMDNQQDFSGDEEEEFDVNNFLSLKKSHQAEERPPKQKSENVSTPLVDDDVETTPSGDEPGDQDSAMVVQDEEPEKDVNEDEDTEMVEAEIQEEDKEEKDAEITNDNEEEETTGLREELEGECPETSSTTSEKVTLESEDSLDALSDSLKSETELPEDVIPPVQLTPFQESVLDCKKIVDSIRKEEFGIGMELEEEAQGLMIRHQERIGRSLKRLSEELYSKDTHFVLELIQNADDNDYLEDVEPSLVFVVDRSEVKALNNERGFSESNIRALCDVGRSTKGKHKSGYIGHKGIGFKSVFRVTDRPEIISKGYHVCFDHSSDPMGYILPTWVGPGDIEEITQMDEPSQVWTTQIKLPLKGDVQRTTSLVNKFADIQPSLLLFLNRLRSVTIVNTDDNSSSHMSRKDIRENVIEIRHSKHSDRWLLTKKRLNASKLQRIQIESTELGLAFPLSEGMSSEQNVFAFLPLRSYGFHFIIQGDFDIPSSREDVDADSAWNQWLLEEIPLLFTEALDTFKTHYHSDPIKAICQFLKFVPLEDQILTNFFKKVASDIHILLKKTPCMPVLTEDEDEVTWYLPSETTMVSDRLVLEVVSSSVLKAHLNCSYLHPQVMSSIEPVLLKRLGVKVLQTSELLDILSSVVLTSRQSGEVLQPKSIAQWLTCVYLSRKREYDISEETLQRLRAISMIPLSCGQIVALEKASVFFPISEEDDQSQGQIQSGSSKPLKALEEDMSTLDSRLLNSLDKVSNSQIVQMLEELGVRHISPGEVIQHHILPVIKSDQWKEKSHDVMVGYAVFIKDHLEKQPSVCDIDEIAEWLHVVTNHGLIKPRDRPVHFTVTYGNKIDLNKHLPGCDWVLLDSRYIFHSGRQVTNTDIRQWHSFFSKLGVLNHLAIEKKVITVKENELEVTPWADLGKFWSKPPGGIYMIHDSVCQELEDLFQADLEASTKQTQRKNLFGLLQQEWSSSYAGYTDAVVFDQEGLKITDTQSSFSIQLRTSSWLPSTPVSGEKAGTVFRRPGEVFVPQARLKQLLSNHVPYMVTEPQVEASLLQFIGVKTAGVIDPNFIMTKLKTWCHDEPSSDRTSFCTSLQHITSVYQYLHENCRPNEIRDLFDDHKVVFTSEARLDPRAPVQGLFVHKNLVYWKDPSGLQQKYKGLNNRIELGGFYSHLPELESFFCGLINVDALPTIKEYAELLVQCASDITLPDNGRIKEEILVLYKMLGQKCLASPSGNRYNQQHDMFAGQQHQTNTASTQFIKRVLEDQSVFPTTSNKWVTLAQRPLICDSSSSDLQKLFEDRREVHLLNFGDRDRLGRVVDGVYKPGTMNRQHVQVFLEACEVGKLEDCIKEEFITELTKPSIPLQLFLYEICPYVQLYMSQSSTKDVQSAYEKLTSEVKIAAKLKIMRFLEAKKIEKVYRYQHDLDVFAKQTVNCGLQDLMEFYVAISISKSLQNNSDVRREVAKLFSVGSIEVQNALFNFLGNLRLELGSKKKAVKGIDESICRALNLNFPLGEDAEPWDVPKPVIPVDPPKMVVKPLQVKPEPEVKPVAAAALEGDEDEAAIYSWPPKSGAFGPTNKISKGAQQPPKEDSVLRSWPPPPQRPVETLPSLHPQGDHQFTDEQQQPADGMSQEGMAASVRMLPRQGSQEGGMLMRSGSREGGQGVGRGVTRDGLPASQQHQPSGGDTRLPRAPEFYQSVAPQAQSVDKSGVVKADEERYNRTSSVSEDEDVDDDDEVGEFSVEGTDESDTSEDEQLPTENAQFSSPPRIHFTTPQSSGTPKKFCLPQLMDGEAVTVEFEDIPYGTALQHSLADVDLHLGDDRDMSDVGRWGEKLVYKYLIEMAKDDPSVTVNWINEYQESGEPYDIILNHGDSEVYIEVKSTLRDQKELFEISSREVVFAQAHQKYFHLYRVYNVGKTSAVRLCRVCNLADRLDKKEVKLFMLL
ncbi:uncharacterized protein LOC117295789 isoform X1 [Asterias rubens]|uniref:uncharacterized protein LOC117295789 isoform X1 n=1 Tax=Asterias rubens TaxID=7604 RepID=UPI0014554915|nr:uncharacterized protein LOC117295789 isoform X1 [Asterias rubens]XP_033634435.1 uncharacterized protein LOC117295789 isoform X1 [Asterias rubens]XP_033634436.1 uncharacterized protein LOC117295789 isoform X1 [Asterias rubens]